MYHMLCVRCHMLHVTYHLSLFAGHMLLTPTATDMDPPPANSPTMHSRVVYKYNKNLLFSAWRFLTISEPNKKKTHRNKYKNKTNILKKTRKKNRVPSKTKKC